MLPCIFRAKWFHTYVFGWAFTIESDHKPLEQINLKNLADTPAWLQQMLLRLQNYDVTIKYHPSKEILVTDTLSRYSPLVGQEVALDSNSPCPHHPREETGVPENNPRWPTLVYSCWHNSGRMAWGYQGCVQSSTPIPQPPWHHD